MSEMEAKQITVSLLEQLLGSRNKTLSVRLWDGMVWPDTAPRDTTLVLKHPGALRAMFLPGTEVRMGEAYLYDDVDIEGNVEAIFDAAGQLTQVATDWGTRLRLARALLRLPVQADGREKGRGTAKLRGRQH